MAISIMHHTKLIRYEGGVVKKLDNIAHTHTHTHIYINTCKYLCCMYVCVSFLVTNLILHHLVILSITSNSVDTILAIAIDKQL